MNIPIKNILIKEDKLTSAGVTLVAIASVKNLNKAIDQTNGHEDS